MGGQKSRPTEDEYQDKKTEILAMLQKGVSINGIRSSLGIPQSPIKKICEELIEEGLISEEEIVAAREKRRTEDLDDLEENLKPAIDQFRTLKPELGDREVLSLVKELIESKRIIREQPEKTIIDQIRKYTMLGYSLQEIPAKINYSYSYVLKLKSNYEKENGWFSKEELKEFRSQRKIREFEALSQEEKDRIVEEKRQKELRREAAKQQRREELLAQRQERQKQTLEKHQRDIETIKSYVRKSKRVSEIAEMTSWSVAYIYLLIKESKEAGTWLTEEELEELEQKEKDRVRDEKKQKELRRETSKHQRRSEVLTQRQESQKQRLETRQRDIETIKAYVKELKTAPEIAEITSWTTAYIYRLRKESKASGTWLTEEELQQIKEKRKDLKKKKKAGSFTKKQKIEKHQKDIEIIKTYRKALKTVQEIADINSWTTPYIYQLIKESKEAGTWLTEEELQEIKEKRKDLKKKTKAEALAQKQEHKKQRIEARQKDIETIKAYVKELKTAREIAEITSWTKDHVYQLIKESKAAGTWLTEEELHQIEEKRELAKKEKKDAKNKKRTEALTKKLEKHQKDTKTIKAYVKALKTIQEIAEITSWTTTYIYQLIKESKAAGTWLTEEELRKIEEKRKQSEQQRKMKEVYQIRELAMDGFITQSELSEKMHYSIPYVKNLITIAIEQKLWFSDRTLKKFKELRKKREEKEAQKKLKQEQDALHAIDVEKRRKIRSFEDEYKRSRKKAKHEDTLEMNGEKDVSTEGRKKFVAVLTKIFAAGVAISKKDITIIMNAIYMNPDFVNKDILKLLIANANLIGGLDEAEKMIKELSLALENTRFRIPLYQYRKWINQQRYGHQIVQLKSQGLKIEEIAQKLGITSAEVVYFQKNINQDVDFFDDDVDK